jgi:hypothetical protein
MIYRENPPRIQVGKKSANMLQLLLCVVQQLNCRVDKPKLMLMIFACSSLDSIFLKHNWHLFVTETNSQRKNFPIKVNK